MTTTKDIFPIIHVYGDHQDAGRNHGEKLKKQIEKSFELYKKFLFMDVPDIELSEIGKQYLERIFNFNEAYAFEIEGIASGAGVDPWQIALLNSRNEAHHLLKGRQKQNECTTLFLPKVGILGQNWDWVQNFEELLAIIIHERRDGHKILQMTEPGVIGKIGLNSSGLGVCLNFLVGRNNCVGIPVHILLRSVLDSGSIEEAEEIIKNAEVASFSNLLGADHSGRFFDFEFFKENKALVHYQYGIPYHTNHYLNDFDTIDPNDMDDREKYLYEDSKIRCLQVEKLLGKAQIQHIELAKNILGNEDNGNHAIYSRYKQIAGFSIGTVCSVVMDLINCTMYITKGNPTNTPYSTFSISHHTSGKARGL